MKPVIDQLLQEATILRMLDEARTRGNPKALGRAKRASAQKASKSSAGQEAEKLGFEEIIMAYQGKKETKLPSVDIKVSTFKRVEEVFKHLFG